MHKTIGLLSGVMGLFFVQSAYGFEDVDKNTFCALPVSYFVSTNSLKDAQTYRPSDAMTRAEAISLLIKTSGSEMVDYDENLGANDVKSEDWYADIMQSGVFNELISPPSLEKPNLNPNKAITEAEFAKMAITAFYIDLQNYPTLPMPGVNQTAWYAPYLNFWVQYDILAVGNPSRELNRCQGAELLFRFMEKGKGIKLPELENVILNEILDEIGLNGNKKLTRGMTLAQNISQNFVWERLLQIEKEKTSIEIAKNTQNYSQIITSAKAIWTFADGFDKTSEYQQKLENNYKEKAQAAAAWARSMLSE